MQSTAVFFPKTISRIELLPALPAAWRSGSVSGLKARGGYTVSFSWKDGVVTSYNITGAKKEKVQLKVNGKIKTVNVKVVKP